MTTLRYGEELIASFVDNTQGLITAENMRDTVASQRSGGGQVQNATTFTVPITDGVPVSINPLLPNPVIGNGFWKADGNNRQYPDYAGVIPGLVIPTNYTKFVQIFWSIAAEKAGSGEDSYTFQADNDGTPIGTGVTISIGVEPTVLSFMVASTATLDGGALLGLTVTGNATVDDINITKFEQFTIDFQTWSAPA